MLHRTCRRPWATQDSGAADQEEADLKLQKLKNSVGSESSERISIWLS